ncbi:MAG: galactose mutarotase [Caldilineaceae bacterium]|nr:galactose mutarotase [Caldilineaceae bacterium]
MRLSSQAFGKTESGQAVRQYTLANNNGVEVDVLDYGGLIRTLTVPDRNGRRGDVVLGFDTLDDYLAEHPYFGVLVGRFANRIRGASFELDGVRYQLARNLGEDHLHGGDGGFDKVVWQAQPFQNERAVGLRLSYHSPDGEDHYPGALDAEVTLSLDDDNALRLDYRATCDAPTIVNLTNHSYFNLAGRGTILDHMAMIDADAFTPMDSTLIPTGELRDVAGTPFDFRQPTAIGARIEADDEQIRFGGGYDHNFVLNGAPGTLRLVARVTEPISGRVLEVLTTQPGVQFYTGNQMEASSAGKDGQLYPHHGGFCLETQHFPNAPNQPNFPSVVLRPGEAYSETTVFRFSTEP